MSELTEFEICKRIAEIEGIGYSISRDMVTFKPCGWPETYNPLTDDGLITNLIFKHEVNVDHYSGVVYIDSDYTGRPPVAKVSFDGLEGMKKAVCLVIIEANK